MNNARDSIDARAQSRAARPARKKSDGEERYELGPEIATGGMAVIRRGFDRWAQREIAHKRLRVDQAGNRARMIALFQREYDTLARLKHPNIVEVYDYGYDEHGPYYAMELLSGSDLAKLAPLSYREACRLLRDVASALALVHARRFVHRDVSPNNVRLTAEGVAKLIDFGALTPFGSPSELAGTAAFIAPESLGDVALDQRADLYSLGALAYWTLTQRTAVVARTISELGSAWDAPIVPPSAYVVGLPARLDELVLSLLSVDPAARPSSAAEVIERLSTIGELEPEQSESKVAYSYLKHPPLVGRELALRELRSALEALDTGRGEVVVVEAATGLGKSALLDQLAVDAQLRGASVLRAEGGSTADKHGVSRRLLQLAARIFPEVETSEASVLSDIVQAGQPLQRPVHPVEALTRSARAAEKLRAMLLRLGDSTPLVILVDDVDKADEESISLLASMTSELSELPILFLLSSADAADRVSSHAYSQLVGHARRISLQSLDEAEVVELTASLFGSAPNSSRVATWLHSQTGGNPAQCIDLLRMLMQRDLVRYSRGAFTLPHDVDEGAGNERRIGSLLTRLSGLTEDAARLFELVCLHRGALDHTQLAGATALGARRVLLAVEQLVQRELVFQRGAEVSLRGESLRRAVEQSLTEEQKQAQHRLLADLFARHSDGSLVSELAKARHLFDAGSESALEGAELMAKLLSRYGHEISISAGSVPLLEAALEVFRARGVSELHCAPLLAALSSTGFYGNIAAQEKYLRPALRALSRQCGFVLAQRLRPLCGVTVALWIGLVYGFWLGFFLPRKLGRTGIKQRIEDFFLVASSGVAVASAVGDLEAAAEIIAALEPLAGFPRRFAPSYSREFCLATAELAQGETLSASKRLRYLLEVLKRPRFALNEGLREQLVLGSMNCKALADIDQGSEESLALAEQLERRSPFFAPHAEVVRALYFAIRGQHQLAELHRARWEALSLRGGFSWTATASISVRTLEATYATGDAVTLSRSVAELQRLAVGATSLRKHRELGLAQLALLRDQPAEAESLLAAVLAAHVSQPLACRLLIGSYAEALNRLERFEQARMVCRDFLACISPAQRQHTYILRMPYLPLAQAEAGLGRLDLAEQILNDTLAHAAGRDNPLELGLLHGALARLALQRKDVLSFDAQRGEMLAEFKRTSHPALMRQCDALLVQALRSGMNAQAPAGFSTALRMPCEALDGTTVVETRVVSTGEQT
ncbi:MAG: pknB11 [Myxococcaceae bacterium]|nr:pknB11 [Myxococcaceae bacterium]